MKTHANIERSMVNLTANWGGLAGLWASLLEEADWHPPGAKELEQLRHYLEQHFLAEEALYQSNNLPNLTSHQRDHQLILQQLEAALHSGKADEYIRFLRNNFAVWFGQHHGTLDRCANCWLQERSEK